MRIRHVAAFAFVVFLGGAVASQEGEEAVIVVTGAKVAQEITEAVEFVEVITEEQIREMDARNLKEIVDHIPGVVVYAHPLPVVMMQGFDGAYVKVLVDGIEIAGDLGGATPVAQLPVAEIERIEIVRGASSVLYGSDAMGGVINIITRHPEEGQFSAQVIQEIATNLRYYGETSAAWANHLFSASVAASYDYDNGDTRKETNNLGDTVTLYEMPLLRFGMVRSDLTWFHRAGDLGLFGAVYDSYRERSTSSETGVLYDDLKTEVGIDGEYAISDFASIDGFATYKAYDHIVDDLNYAFDTMSSDETLFDQMEGEVRFAWEPTISQALLVGVNAKRDLLEGDDFEEQESATMVSLFAQDTWNVGGADRVRIVPGLRFDYSVPGGADEDPILKVSPKLSTRFDPNESVILRLAYGMGFKTPSIKEKYWRFFHPAPANFMLLGNPELRPETSHGFNASVDYTVTPRVSTTLSGYFNYVFDLIDSQIVDEESGSYTTNDGVVHQYINVRAYRNVGEAITSGGDWNVRYNGDRVTTSLGYSFTTAWELDGGNDRYVELPGRVPHQIKSTLAYRIPVLETTATVQADWNAPQLVDREDDTYTPDYLMINIRISRSFLEDRLNAYAGVRNALDNFHLFDGYDDYSQEEYFGLYDGLTAYIGSRLTL